MADRYLTPFNSNRPFFGLQREMNRLFDDFFPTRDGRFFAPDIDVSETDKEIRVAVELPGVAEKDVEVSLDNDMLVISGEKKSETKEEKENYHFSERSFGSFQRALRLPVNVDADKIRAYFDNGVLNVTVPKDGAHPSRGQKIAIEHASAQAPGKK